MNTLPFINIIVPAYNEESRIDSSVRVLVQYLHKSKFPYPFAVTIVDNGSTDGTAACAQRLVHAYPRTIVPISISEKGKGRAVRRGWHEPGEVMVFMDADLSSDLAFLRPLVDAIVIDGYDISIGNRLGMQSHIQGRKVIRGIASHAYNATIRLLFSTNIADHQCGFKAIRKDTYTRLAPLLEDTGWFFDTEFLVIATRLGYSIRSIDIRWVDNRQSKVSLFGTTLDMVKAIYAFQKRLPGVIGGVRPDDKALRLVGEVLRFFISGAVAAIVNVGLFWLLFTVVHVRYLLDVIETSVVVFFVSFALQKLWTFKDPHTSSLPVQLSLYIVSAIATVLANLALIFFLVELVHLWPVLAQMITLAIIAVANFFVYKFLIFRP
jgi:glycosyltransferase involved in cell wall biosynthesis